MPLDESSKPLEDPAGESLRADSVPFEQLDRRWIWLVRSIELLVWGGLGLIVVISGLTWLIAASSAIRFVTFGAWALFAALALIRVVWWPRWDYEHWSYRAGPKVFELRHGVIWKVAVSIPLSRLQHVDLHRGPLERRRGLASLQLHTAGTKEASQLIPGLDFRVAESLRDRLIDSANRGGHVSASP